MYLKFFVILVFYTILTDASFFNFSSSGIFGLNLSIASVKFEVGQTLASNLFVSSKKDCTKDEYKCDEKCFPSAIRCNGSKECNDGSDERECQSRITISAEPNTEIQSSSPPTTTWTPSSNTTAKNSLTTGLLITVPSSTVGTTTEESIKTNATSNSSNLDPRKLSALCLPGEIQCESEDQCIPMLRRCDGFFDCRDESDEKNCLKPTPCLPSEFQCKSKSQCIPIFRQCDGFSDCRDESDEKYCPKPTTCLPNEFQCESKDQCIPILRKCDGIRDCRDESDEKYCPKQTSCLPNEFQCESKDRCIPKLRLCDGYPDCRDISDEKNCTLSTNGAKEYLDLQAYPDSQVVKENQTVVFICKDRGPLRARITWDKYGGLLPPGSRIDITEGRLEISNIQLTDGGIYICRAINDAALLPGSHITVNLRVDPWPQPPTLAPVCRTDEAVCRNGVQCIPISSICNGQRDCTDGSDEEPRCHINRGNRTYACEPNEFSCANRRCIKSSWVCDGEDDCGDRSDESNCTQSSAGTCNEAGSLSAVPDPTTGLCNCKINAHGMNCSQCKPNTFHLSPSNAMGCKRCFCMNVTSDCVSSRLHRNQIVSSFNGDSQNFKIGSRSEVESNASNDVRIELNQGEIIYSSFVPETSNVYYWTLPQKFLGNKITSYGGYLNYTIRYVPTPGSQMLKNNAPDVEIVSEFNSIHLFFFYRGPIEPNVSQTISIPILEQYWRRNDGQLATSELLLMALADVKAILVKASYTADSQETGLQNVTMDVAEDRNTGQNLANEVEECKCPVGYRGTSCEECDIGYYREDHGLNLGVCEPCQCNGYSKECDPKTGACLNCVNHTSGDHCEICELGYIGNPEIRQPCTLFKKTCNCDSRGSLSSDCHDGVCLCKANVAGSNCDSCKPGTFDLQADHKTGCLSCYCSGVSSQCQSSNYSVTQIPMQPLFGDHHGFTLMNINRERIIRNEFTLNVADNLISYNYTGETEQLFWSLPANFIGHKISSYGGNLTWMQGYNVSNGAHPVLGVGDQMVIFGDGISIHWNDNSVIFPNTYVPKTVKLVEDGFYRIDKNGTQMATRSDLLRVLSDIESILIRASHASQTSLVFIGDVSLSTAVPQMFSSAIATHVENCRCPPGHWGLSCELCIPGFYQVASQDGYVKECKKCPCNGHEESCSLDLSFNVICKCKPGYSGEFCNNE